MKNNIKKENYYKKIGDKLKRARLNKGFSQGELAKEIGFKSATAISLIEKGERKIDVSYLGTLAEILDVEIGYFIEDKYKDPDFKVALRAEKDLTKDKKDQIIEFYNFIKNKK